MVNVNSLQQIKFLLKAVFMQKADSDNRVGSDVKLIHYLVLASFCLIAIMSSEFTLPSLLTSIFPGT